MAANPRDFLSTLPGTAIAWGLPVVAMIVAVNAPQIPTTWVWVGGLVWMGIACLWNARRCKRTHCFWTGPFFLVMILPVLGHGLGIVPLGGNGWQWLGAAIGIGAFGLVFWTERGGKYLRKPVDKGAA